MIIRYYSAHTLQPKYIVERDLSREKIVRWEIYPESRLGYKGGNLSIGFDVSHLEKVINEGGIYPPIPEIINFEEVLAYLKRNFAHLQNAQVTEVEYLPKSEQKKSEKKTITGFFKNIFKG